MELYVAKVNFYDECSMEEDIEYRLIAGKNYSDAVAATAEYYGEENIIDLTISCISDGNGSSLLDTEYEQLLANRWKD